MATSFVGRPRLFAGILGRPKELPMDDIAAGLERLCSIPLASKGNERSHIPSSNFNEITNILKHYETHTGLKGWATRPRLFTILRGIRRLDTMATFIQKNFTDFDIPFNPADLPRDLGNDVDAFIQLQEYVLTTARELELGEKGRHCRYPYDGDDHFIKLRYLGSGVSGDVAEVWSRLSHKRYARKRFKRDTTTTPVFQKELQTLKRLSHRHLIKIMGSYTDPRYLAILTTPIADYNLKDFLDSIAPHALPELRSYFGCLARTITYLHSRKVYHMDIKPQNILIKGRELYVADFGSAHDWSLKDRSTTWSDTPKTHRYMPPELAKDPYSPRNHATDMWSLGIVFLDMVTVLKGKSIVEFRTYLTENGTKHPFPYGNLSAMSTWMETLRLSNSGNDFDNEPLVWVKDMTHESRADRLQARDLTREILNSSSGFQFRQICCAHDDDDDFIGDSFDAEDARSTVEPDYHVPLEDEAPDQLAIFQSPGQSASKMRSIEAWLSREESLPFVEQSRPGDFGKTATCSESPFDIEEDEEPDVTLKAEPKIRHIPARLENFNLLDQPPEPMPRTQIWEDVDDYSPFDIDDDSCSSDDSELTARPQDALDDAFEIVEDSSDEEETPTTIDEPFHDGSKSSELPQNSGMKVDSGSSLGGKSSFLEDNDHTFLPSNDLQKSTLHPGPPQLDKTSHIDSALPDNGKDEDKHRHKVEENTPQSGITFTIPLLSNFKAGAEKNEKTRTSPKSVRFKDSGDLQQEKTHSKASEGQRLTTKNLEKLVGKGTESKNKNKQEASKIRSPASDAKATISGRKFSAKDYIQNVWEAESSAATSVLSNASKAKFGASLSLTKWQDKSQNFLGAAAKQGKAAAVRELLERHCNPGTQENPRKGPIISAVKGGTERHLKCARLLIEHGADVNIRSGGKTPLHFAVGHEHYKGYTKLIAELLSASADPNATDSGGDTPLLKVLHGGYEPLPKHRRDALALLLYYGADVNATPRGTLNKPLHLAVRRKDQWAVGMLLEKGASVNEPNGAGSTPLALCINGWSPAMNDRQLEVLQLLLDAGAPVNQQVSSNGDTALHLAAFYGNIQEIEMLLEHDADPAIKNGAGSDVRKSAAKGLEMGKLDAKLNSKVLKMLEQTKSGAR